jgi:RNA polymerase sigma factor (sigma-70 family)
MLVEIATTANESTFKSTWFLQIDHGSGQKRRRTAIPTEQLDGLLQLDTAGKRVKYYATLELSLFYIRFTVMLSGIGKKRWTETQPLRPIREMGSMNWRHPYFDPASTCWTLIQGAADGQEKDRAAFAHLYQPAVKAYLEARWKTAPLSGDVNDATQEVFVACFQDDGALVRVKPDTPNSSFRKFLFIVVQNVAKRFEERRRRNREIPVGSGFTAAGADEERLSGVFERAWISSMLDQAVALQKDRAREKGEDAMRRLELLSLRFYEGLPIREIARRWDVPADKLHHQYTTAREEFMTALKNVLAFNHPGDREARKRDLERIREFAQGI